MPTTAVCRCAGNGGFSGVPRTSCVDAVGIGSRRPGRAFSGSTMRVFVPNTNIGTPTVCPGAVSLRDSSLNRTSILRLPVFKWRAGGLTVMDMLSAHHIAWEQMQADRAFRAAKRRRVREALVVHDQTALARRTPGGNMVREIPLAAIVGTFDAGRARDFDRRFRPLERTRKRWLRV